MWQFHVCFGLDSENEEYHCALSEADLNMVLLPNVLYITVEDERNEREYVMGMLGKIKIHEHNPLTFPPSITLMHSSQEMSQAFIIPCKADTHIFIETPDHVFMILDILQKNEKEGNKVIREKLKRYCKVNFIHNYSRDYVLN